LVELLLQKNNIDLFFLAERLKDWKHRKWNETLIELLGGCYKLS
jgi:hypothetical protein